MNKNLPTTKGLRTFIQAIPGFIIGYFVTIWAVPGVPEATIKYLQADGVQLILTLGVTTAIATGIVSLIQNKIEDRKK